ncbi:MAG: aldose epimerase family protein [Muribaculaceae bacterium]
MMIEKTMVSTRVGEIAVYRLTNRRGNVVELSSLGAGITRIIVPDGNGQRDDIVLGYSDYADYMRDGACAGKTPGRFANRIALGRFSIDGCEYRLDTNNGPNALHGGNGGFHSVLWDSEETERGVRFTYRSADGEEGYPGNLTAVVHYAWSDDDELLIEYEATTDRPTIVNLTNHAYFNLAGAGSGLCLQHKLKLDCSQWLPGSDVDIPSGEIATVAGTPMDFTAGKELGADIDADFSNLRIGKGYNHFFIADGFDGTMRHIATLTEAESRRRLDVATTQWGVMLYTGNWLASNEPCGRHGARYADYAGVALECQGAPDAPNHPNFPSTVLRPGEIYREAISYRFTVE